MCHGALHNRMQLLDTQVNIHNVRRACDCKHLLDIQVYIQIVRPACCCSLIMLQNFRVPGFAIFCNKQYTDH